MKIGMLHQYSLYGSGSSVYVRDITMNLARMGHEVHLISPESRPERYDFFEAADFHDENGSRPIFSKNDKPSCISHTLEMSPVPVAYSRIDLPESVPFTSLTDTQIEKHTQFFSRKVIDIAGQNGFDVIHAHHMVLTPFIAALVKAELSIPYIVTIHGSVMEYVVLKDIRYRDYALRGLEEAENVIVLNHDVRKRVLKIFPELESKLVHIPVGADGRMFKPIPSQQHLLSVEEFIQNLRDRGERGKDTDLAKQTRSALNIRKDAGIQAEVIDIQERYNASYPDADIQRKFKNIDWQKEKIIVFFGKLLYDKGLHCLITAMPNILSAFPNTRLIVIGSGVDREYMEMGVAALDQGDIAFFKKMMLLGTSVRKNCGGFYDYIDQYFKKTDQKLYADRARGNMRQRVIFTGYLTRYGLSKLLPCAQMAIIPSIVKEAFPMVSIESLACGVIPVASYFSGLAPILDEVCGLLGEPGDLVKIGHRPEKMIQDLSDNIPALLSVLSDKKNMTRFSDRFRRLVESKYRWKTIITEIIDLYAAQCV